MANILSVSMTNETNDKTATRFNHARTYIYAYTVTEFANILPVTVCFVHVYVQSQVNHSFHFDFERVNIVEYTQERKIRLI